MTKLRVAHSIKDEEFTSQKQTSKRLTVGSLWISALSVATAISALGMSQVACAELTWGDEESYQQESNYQQDRSIDSFMAAAIAADRGDVGALYN
ncbi:MAG TPA: lytic transglycosylase, partial [Psychrobacter sp.]|nr:lytic transglycosylase [Psychrobacter sp.]